MCGRFTLITDAEVFRERFEIYNKSDKELNKRYNIAPTQDVLAVINDGKGNKAGFLRWGLVPNWSKDPSIGSKMINARAETIDEKPSFNKLLKRRRCIIVADSFYEWKRIDGKKRPYRIKLRNDELFSFAGLWDVWEKNGEKINSCTIITTEPNKVMKDIHNRMPVILPKDKEEIWLDRSIQEPDYLKQMLIPYLDEDMEAYEVSPTVNSSRVDTPECIARINY